MHKKILITIHLLPAHYTTSPIHFKRSSSETSLAPVGFGHPHQRAKMEFPSSSGMSRKRFNHCSRLAAVVGFAFFMTIAMSACSRNNFPAGGAALNAAVLRADQEHGTLAREHSVTVEVPETELDARFQRLADRCKTDSAPHCTILQPEVSTGQYPSALIVLRDCPRDLAGRFA